MINTYKFVAIVVLSLSSFTVAKQPDQKADTANLIACDYFPTCLPPKN